MRDVERLLAELREHGTIDSRGEFTLSLSEARRKLTQYHSSETARYLLLWLSAGTAAGASQLVIEQNEAICRLMMPGAHIPENALLSAFADPSRPAEEPGASDLILGLQGAFHAGADRLEVQNQKPGESFLWTLEKRAEKSVPIESGGETMLQVVAHFPAGMPQKLRSLFQRLRGGYAARSPEARLLDQYCDRSLLPITYNGERTDRPLFLPPHAVSVLVGELEAKSLQFKADCQLQDLPWRGALALGNGAAQIVIHGVAYCQVENCGVVGTIYHDGLTRDISREKVVHDASYRQLLQSLETVRVRLHNELVGKLPSLLWAQSSEALPDLVYLFLSRKLSGENRKALWHWMEDRWRRKLGPEAPSSERTASGLISLMMGLLENESARQRVLNLLLADCGDGLRERPPHLLKRLETAHELFRSAYPEETLVLGYLLLGLGALHDVEGRKSESERAWFKALETVWAGRDQRAQELMYGHMAFSPDHILQQSSAALAMYCQEQDVADSQSAPTPGVEQKGSSDRPYELT